MAQSSTVASKTSDADIVFDTAAVNKTLDTLTKKLNTKKVSREETDDFMDTLTALQTQTQNAQKQIATEINNISKKISALNSSSAEGDEDLPEIAKEKAKYEAEAAKYKSQQAQAALILTKIDEINNLGVVKIRLRSMLAAIEEQQSREEEV